MKFLLLVLFVLDLAKAETLSIIFYDKAHLGAIVRERADAELTRIFQDTGIQVLVAWGDLSSPEASLVEYSQILPGVRQAEAVCRARRDIAVQLTTAPSGVSPAILGIAHPLAQHGVNARIFVNRVRIVAENQKQSYAIVLAHAVAHEIGHVLLRSNEHDSFGLLAAVWTPREYRLMDQGSLGFLHTDGARMRRTLAGNGCRGTDSAAKVQQSFPTQ